MVVAVIIFLSFSQMCPTALSLKASDKENNVRQDNPIHREILDKLKHEAVTGGSQDAQLLTEQLANYHKLRAAAMSDNPMAAEMLRREALLSLQSVRPKLDYFSQLAALQEQHQMLTASQPAAGVHQRGSISPVRTSQSPEGSEDGDSKMDSLSPNHVPSAGSQWTYEEQFKQVTILILSMTEQPAPAAYFI